MPDVADTVRLGDAGGALSGDQPRGISGDAVRNAERFRNAAACVFPCRRRRLEAFCGKEAQLERLDAGSYL